MRLDVCMSGAGSKAPLHIGFIRCLESKNVKYNELYGTSSGSIVASMIATGYNSYMMEREVRKTDLSQFAKISIWRNIINILSSSWLNNGNKLEKYLDDLFSGKTLDMVDYPLHILAHNLNSSTWVDFNSREHPTMKISKAVRMSCSLPILYKPVFHGGNYYVDGGISKNFALDLSDKRVISHLVWTDEPKDLDWQAIRKSQMGIKIISQMINSNVRESIRDKANCVIIQSSYSKSTYDFSLEADEINAMMKMGFNNTAKKMAFLYRV